MSFSPFDIPPRRKPDGSVCCEFFDEAGPRLLQACDECQTYYLDEARQRRDAEPPNPYTRPLAAMRAAQATDASRFEDAYKQSRRADVEATRRALAAEEPAARLTTAELNKYAPPNSYEAGLKALRERERR